MLQIYKPKQAFLQDGAPIHTVNATKELLEELRVWVEEHPVYNLDFNVIEHLWLKLKKAIFELRFELKTMKRDKKVKKLALKQAIRDTFNLLLGNEHGELFDFPVKLIHSMPVRLQAVRRANGWQTKY